MKKRTKVVIGLIVAYSMIRGVLKACDKIEANLASMIKEKQEEAVDKVVDEFVVAAVTCRTFTIESKHNGKATVRIVKD